MSTIGQACLEFTARLLGHWPEAPYRLERRETSLKVLSEGEGTFSISMYDEGDQVMIAAERWHTHYDAPEQAGFCALWLLTPFYRLVEEYKGGLMVATWIEAYEEEGWVGTDPVYFLNPEYPPEWKLGPEEVYTRRYIQHALVDAPEPFDQIYPNAKLNAEGLPEGSQLGVMTIQATEPVGPTLL